MKKFVSLIVLQLFTILLHAAPDALSLNEKSTVLINSQHISLFEDKADTAGFNYVMNSNNWTPVEGRVPNKGISNSAFWLKFSVTNTTSKSELMIYVHNSQLNYVDLYYQDDSITKAIHSGNQVLISKQTYNNQNPTFFVKVPKNTTKTFYLKIKSHGQIIIPTYVGSHENVQADLGRDDFLFGIYIGIILVMFFYNIFVYFTVRDINYLYYVMYIFCVGLAQFCIYGYGYRFVWGENNYIISQSLNWSGALSGISVALFLRVFLQTSHNIPVFDKILQLFIFSYCISLALTMFGLYNIGYIIIDVVAFVGCISIWIAGFRLSLKGNRAARFFIVAWSFFLLSVIFFVLKDLDIVQYNLFTNSLLLIGSALEVTLLSFALADKINILQKEKELSQAEALRVSQENEGLVREQNVILERKVAERTDELQNSNNQLNSALTELKDAQTQLVEAEKMASLGQLTAGIAHEINNPINFVKSNIKPLQLDINDLFDIIDEYNKLHEVNGDDVRPHLKKINSLQQQIDVPFVKSEIKSLIKGIEEGADRTAEIVRGLRTFSRLDESEMKTVNVHEGIDSTLVLLKNSTPYNIAIKKDFKANGEIDCYPGKLNQVFMNIINNGIQAIMAKKPMGDSECITISTRDTEDEKIQISIKDSGIGMTEEVKQKIYEPFFTTKDVGEGTGLGMAIVFKIINNHHGKIDIISSPGNGAEFVLTLPHTLT
ncbi:7TM diverse intracellular signaling domain-containing protein [Danxiaibacter flavus]|uniref:histidine kinase n=1 Tax=Danxiaibacter flavus TaxID=3049108 RepID=A0ABV3ZFZ6_9BACT|nr:7TM diverse intracellular signaling domain-containing protein [Chitinophagaceae bacterium DXS]